MEQFKKRISNFRITFLILMQLLGAKQSNGKSVQESTININFLLLKHNLIKKRNLTGLEKLIFKKSYN